ncbi:MAG: alanine racemase [Anaerolineae bacterium]
MRVSDIETPALVLDLDRVERNIAETQAYCDEHGLAFRPHIKTHKIPALAHWQMRAGAVGIACQKLGEAEVMAAAGVPDILIPYNIIGASKLERLVRLTHQAAMSVAVDSELTVRGLSEAMAAHGTSVGVLIEVATTIERAGVVATEEVIRLARLIESLPGLEWRGIMLYPSNAENAAHLQAVCEALDAAGLTPKVVSGGGSPSMRRQHEVPRLTEVRIGTYIFEDMTGVRGGYFSLERCAATLLCTVVSAPTPDRVILDGGSKTLTTEGGPPFGYIVELPDAQIYKLNEEHAYVDVSACPTKPQIGDRVHVIPNHVCVAVNLHNQAYGVRGDWVEVIWPIAARGLVQ